MAAVQGFLSRLFGGGRISRTASWPLSEGIITLYSQSGDNSELSYSYNVNGRNFYGHTLNFLIRPEYFQPNVDIEDQALPIRVRYNPEQPSNCSLAGKDNPHLHFRVNASARKALLIQGPPVRSRVPQS